MDFRDTLYSLLAINFIRLKFTISNFIDIIRKNKREN
jgi:hypothetical protein